MSFEDLPDRAESGDIYIRPLVLYFKDLHD